MENKDYETAAIAIHKALYAQKPVQNDVNKNIFEYNIEKYLLY
jgi:hypothetical protein